MKLGFLASGNGSSARAMVDAIAAGELAAEAGLMASNKPSAPALAWAQGLGIPAVCVPTAADPEGADKAITDAMQARGVELIVLSGYLRRLGPVLLSAYRGRILNIHPALLPAFGGEGMYGRRVHEAVLAAGAAESGATIHVVDGDYDSGPIVAQRAVPVLAGDTPADLEGRVKLMEPQFFVETMKRIANGELGLPRR